MANTLRIKRSASTATPSSLANAELAYSEQSNKLFIGVGTGGAGGSATSVVAIGGTGAYVTLDSAQSITGNKTFSGTVDLTSATATATTQPSSDNSTKLATTAYVQSHNFGFGSVTSVGLSLPNIFSVTGSPVTTSGTLTASLTSQSGNVIFAGPNGSTGAPTFRALVAADIPNLTASKITDFDTQVQTNRLDELASPTSAVDFNSQRISGVATPTQATDAANKGYVDGISQGLDVKASVRVATTANITLSGTQTIDGVTLIAGNRVLVKNQTSASGNGIYVVASGAWTRAEDFDADADVTAGAFTFVEEGTNYADTGWVLTTNDPITVGSTSLAFTQFSGTGSVIAGNGLSQSGATFNVGTASSSRIVINADTIDLATTAVSAGTYKSVTVDTYGRVTGGTNPTTLSGYGITDAQPLDGTLTALAGVTTSANQLIYATGADTFSVSTLSAFGRNLIDDADAAAARTTLGLGSMSTQAANNVAITGGTIDGITFDGGTF